MGLGRFYGARPALPLPFSLLVLAPHLEGRERRLCWTGLLDVSDHGPEPRGRAGRVPGAPAFPAGSERGRGFRYLPPSTGKLTRAALRTGLECSEKDSGRPGPCRADAGGAGARRGQSPPCLPCPLRSRRETRPFPHSFSPTYLHGSNLTLLITYYGVAGRGGTDRQG